MNMYEHNAYNWRTSITFHQILQEDKIAIHIEINCQIFNAARLNLLWPFTHVM